ncbi:MAG TPA: SDR family NAD(P)-dependent oxidoreductase, partial [Thermoanaerobaculia bacterium]|nr:SDR family NAD(P)-dependent oxidoreductase [Thermoanaerobaculia bacterium]
MPSPLEGKIVLVTGGGVRVGRAIAVALGAAGADVAVHFRGSAAGAESAAGEVRAAGRRAMVVAGDLARPDDCRRVARASIDG